MKKEYSKYSIAVFGLLIIFGGVSAYVHTQWRDASYRSMVGGGREQEERTFMSGGYRQFENDAPQGEFTQRLSLPTDTSALSEQEVAGLLKMREEEKLARDVYLTLGEKWNVPVFKNIAVSEQQHTDAVKSLLAVHRVAYEESDDSRGVFQNQDITKLYTELTLRGSESVSEAYRVGAYIEDLDIADLDKEIVTTTHNDIRFVYENLKRGSENHMRAFNRNLEIATGTTYEPSRISKDALELILENENSMMGERSSMMQESGSGYGSVMGFHDGSGRGRGMGRW